MSTQKLLCHSQKTCESDLQGGKPLAPKSQCSWSVEQTVRIANDSRLHLGQTPKSGWTVIHMRSQLRKLPIILIYRVNVKLSRPILLGSSLCHS